MEEYSNSRNELQPPFSAPTSPSFQRRMGSQHPPHQRPHTPYPSLPELEAAAGTSGYSQQDGNQQYDEDFLLVPSSQEATPQCGENFLEGVQIPGADLDFGLDPSFTSPPFDASAFGDQDFDSAYGQFALFDVPESHYGGARVMQPPVLPSTQTDDTTFLRRELHTIEERVGEYKTRVEETIGENEKILQQHANELYQALKALQGRVDRFEKGETKRKGRRGVGKK